MGGTGSRSSGDEVDDEFLSAKMASFDHYEQTVLPRKFSNQNFLSGKFEDVKIVNNLGSQRVGSSLYRGIYQDTEITLRCFVLDERDLESYKEHVLKLSTLRNPHIISFYVCIVNPPRYGIVAEFCKYGSLKSIIERRQCQTSSCSFPCSERLRIVFEVCSAVKYLHSLNVVHEELRISHVLLDDQFVVKLKDFGIESTFREKSRKVGPMKREEGYYLAPEISLEKSIRGSKHADIYALSILTYVIISMNLDPYSGLIEIEKDPNLSLKSLFRPSLSKLREGIMPDLEDQENESCQKTWELLEDLLKKGWAQEASERWTIDEFYEKILEIREVYGDCRDDPKSIVSWREEVRKSFEEKSYKPTPVFNPIFQNQDIKEKSENVNISPRIRNQGRSRSQHNKSDPKVIYLRRREESDEDSEDFLLRENTLEGLKKVICEWASCDESKIEKICKVSKGKAVRRITKDGTVSLLSPDSVLVVDFK